jgi:hypothetical protein
MRIGLYLNVFLKLNSKTLITYSLYGSYFFKFVEQTNSKFGFHGIVLEKVKIVTIFKNLVAKKFPKISPLALVIQLKPIHEFSPKIIVI